MICNCRDRNGAEQNGTIGHRKTLFVHEKQRIKEIPKIKGPTEYSTEVSIRLKSVKRPREKIISKMRMGGRFR